MKEKTMEINYLKIGNVVLAIALLWLNANAVEKSIDSQQYGRAAGLILVFLALLVAVAIHFARK